MLHVPHPLVFITTLASPYYRETLRLKVVNLPTVRETAMAGVVLQTRLFASLVFSPLGWPASFEWKGQGFYKSPFAQLPFSLMELRAGRIWELISVSQLRGVEKWKEWVRKTKAAISSSLLTICERIK